MPYYSRRSFRHRVHLLAYGFVSFASIILGIIFTFFALFERDSLIGKVWLAGPTTLAVGIVLCGKVIIDYKPVTSNGSVDGDDTENPTSVDFCSDDKMMSVEMLQMKEYLDGCAGYKTVYSARKELISSDEFKESNKTFCPCECDVWHLRDDCTLDSTKNKTVENSLNTTTSNENLVVENLRKKDIPYLNGIWSQKSTPNCASNGFLNSNENNARNSCNKNLHIHGNNSRLLPSYTRFDTNVKKSNKLNTVDNPSIYQGETFLFNDRQYLI